MTEQYDDRKLKEVVERLGPWFYCWSLPGGATTGGSDTNILLDKMKLMLQGGAFAKPTYPHVLDLGANSGYISKWFAENKGSLVTAVENARTYHAQLQFIVAIYGLTDIITPVRADVLDPAMWARFGMGEFDLILLLGLLHHLPEDRWEDLLLSCYHALSPGGEIVVQTDSRIAIEILFRKCGFTLIIRAYEGIQERSAWMAKRPLGS